MSFVGKFVERINAHCTYNKVFFEYLVVYEIMWKNTVEPGRPEDNTTPAHCMLDTLGYKYTLRICNTYCFSTATLVTRPRLNVTLYLHCLCC
jgi:hypothetical protein